MPTFTWCKCMPLLCMQWLQPTLRHNLYYPQPLLQPLYFPQETKIGGLPTHLWQDMPQRHIDLHTILPTPTPHPPPSSHMVSARRLLICMYIPLLLRGCSQPINDPGLDNQSHAWCDSPLIPVNSVKILGTSMSSLLMHVDSLSVSQQLLTQLLV